MKEVWLERKATLYEFLGGLLIDEMTIQVKFLDGISIAGFS
jgi:hypothetical protein